MPIEPELSEVIRKAIAFDRLHLHTALPGKVVSYDAAKQTCSAQLMVKHPSPVDGGDIEFEPMPTIPDVPVGWFGGGGVSFQMPLQAGDFVEIIFDEADVGAWRESGQEANPVDLERHGLSSCIALPVRRPNASPLRSVTSGPHLEVPDGKFFSVGESPGSMNFVALANLVLGELNSLKSAVEGHGHGVSTTGTAAAQTGSTTSLTGFSYSPSSVAASRLKTQ